jgi:hypothetical protein
MNSLIKLVCIAPAQLLVSPLPAQQILVEAESFHQPGGWVLDTQFIENMGSPYLLAHGMGVPVKDAETEIQIVQPGRYRVWVRTKDWVAHWDAPGAPGRFQVEIDGRALNKDFGTQGEDWFWEDGGTVDLSEKTKIALVDKTGFAGRCDAILLSKDETFIPPEDIDALKPLRRKLLGLPNTPPVTPEYDFVVVGGGYSGMGAAISAARQGLKVGLIQNRPVLGGNGSSEVQVWAMGGTRRGLFPHLGEIVEEFADRASNSPAADPAEFDDALKDRVVRAERTLDLFVNTHVFAAEVDAEKRIRSVTALNTKTGKETRFRGKFFCDATGYGSLGAMAGASFMMEDTNFMGMSNMWVMKNTGNPVAWPDTPWALPLGLKDFPLPRPLKPFGKGNVENLAGRDPSYKPVANPQDFLHGEWFWESGFYKDPFKETERIRDWNFRAVYGAVSAMKKLDPEKYANHALHWLAYIGGPRESRRITGDFVLKGEDMVKGVVHPDGCVPTTWDQDLHYPREQYAAKFPDNPFISRAQFGKHTDRKNGYPVPYRCLYSKDVSNLFVAGRNISVDRAAMGSTRVMRTCGMFGEVAGKAAWICVRHETTPRGVYEKHLDTLKDLMRQPGAARRDRVEGELVIPANTQKPPQ